MKCLIVIVLSCVLLSCGTWGVMVYSARDFSPRQRVDGGYKLISVADKARLVFPQAGWKLIEVTYPGGNYVVEPTTGACLRFDSISFGRKYNPSPVRSYVTSEHQWAQKFKDTTVREDNEKEFFREWIDRALIRGEIKHPDDLAIVYPALVEEKTGAVLHPLELDPSSGPINVKRHKVGSHSYSYAEMPTRVRLNGQSLSLETSVWISYFRYVPRFKEWQFFAAFSHIPTDLPPSRKQEIRELLERTLLTLSIQLIE
jgi:hypothetical protein